MFSHCCCCCSGEKKSPHHLVSSTNQMAFVSSPQINSEGGSCSVKNVIAWLFFVVFFGPLGACSCSVRVEGGNLLGSSIFGCVSVFTGDGWEICFGSVRKSRTVCHSNTHIHSHTDTHTDTYTHICTRANSKQ